MSDEPDYSNMVLKYGGPEPRTRCARCRGFEEEAATLRSSLAAAQEQLRARDAQAAELGRARDEAAREGDALRGSYDEALGRIAAALGAPQFKTLAEVEEQARRKAARMAEVLLLGIKAEDDRDSLRAAKEAAERERDALKANAARETERWEDLLYSLATEAACYLAARTDDNEVALRCEVQKAKDVLKGKAPLPSGRALLERMARAEGALSDWQCALHAELPEHHRNANPPSTLKPKDVTSAFKLMRNALSDRLAKVEGALRELAREHCNSTATEYFPRAAAILRLALSPPPARGAGQGAATDKKGDTNG